MSDLIERGGRTGASADEAGQALLRKAGFEVDDLGQGALRRADSPGDLATKYSQKSARQSAEDLLIEEARRDVTLLAPRGEIRWFGVPLVAVGGRRGKQTLMSRFVEGAQIEQGFAKFREGLVKGAKTYPQPKLFRDVLEKIGSFRRRVSEPFDANLSKDPEWILAGAKAEGTAAANMLRDNGLLQAIKLSKTENDLLLQVLSNPYPTAPPGASRRIQRALTVNTGIDAIYDVLSQEANKGIKRGALEDLAELVGPTGVGKKLRDAIDNAVGLSGDDALGEIPRTEIFFRNPDAHLKRYQRAISEKLGSKRTLDQMTQRVEAYAKAGVIPKDLGRLEQELFQLRTTDAAMYKKRVEALDELIGQQGELLIGKGDRSAIITPFSRDAFMEMTQQAKRSNRLLPKLRPVTNAKEHIMRRGQVAYNKQAMSYLFGKAAALSSDDAFARRVLEEHLIPTGSLEANVNVNVTRVDDAIDAYVASQAMRKIPEPGLAKAIGKLKTKEEMQLFFRKWLLGEGGFKNIPQVEGQLSRRIYEAMSYVGDTEHLSPKIYRKPSFEAEPEHIMGAFIEESQEFRKVLADAGTSVEEMMPRINMSGIMAEDGFLWEPFRNLHFERGQWRLTHESTGDHLYLPQSLSRSLNRMSEAAISNPETGRILQVFDAYQNTMKLMLTAVGGFPSFQLRNAYSNAAFGFTAANIHVLQGKANKLAWKFAWQGTDPRLALTSAGYKNALRMRTMKDVAIEAGDVGMATVENVERAILDHYTDGRKAAKALSADPLKVRKEAEELVEQLNQVAIRDDFGAEWTVGQLMRAVEVQGVNIDPRALAEFTGVAEKFRSNPSMISTSVEWLRDKALRSNAMFEQFSRQQLFFSYIARGRGAEEAGRLANKWLLDYQALSPTEKNIMKRGMPFYTFYRKNLTLQAEALFTKTGPMSVQAKLLKSPNDPVSSYGSEDGQRAVLRADGNVHIISNIDLPITSVKLYDAIKHWLPSNDPRWKAQGREGMKELGLLMHPLVHSIFSAQDLDLFQSRVVTQKKYDSLGAAMEQFGVKAPFITGHIEKRQGADGIDHYYFDRAFLSNVSAVLGTDRVISNADRIRKTMGQFKDGELIAFIRWGTGIQIENLTARESDIIEFRNVLKELNEEAEKRGIYEKFENYYRPRR